MERWACQKVSKFYRGPLFDNGWCLQLKQKPGIDKDCEPLKEKEGLKSIGTDITVVEWMLDDNVGLSFWNVGGARPRLALV